MLLFQSTAEASARRAPLNRWVDVALAIRAWAMDHPHEYALVYGTPVPGYHAPAETSTSGTRVWLALVGVVRDAGRARELRSPLRSELSPTVARDLERLRGLIDVDVPDDVLIATLLAWTQLFGLLSFELFSQTRGLVEDHDAFFVASATRMGEAIGL